MGSSLHAWRLNGARPDLLVKIKRWDSNGCQLGMAVANLRLHEGIDTTKDEILNFIDFIWDPIRYGFEKVMLPACQCYVQQKGDLNTMSTSFKVPKTPGLYPIACHGYGLGACLHAWRVNGARSDLLKKLKR